MANYEVTDCKSIYKIVEVAYTDGLEGSYETPQETTVYKVEPPFNPGEGFTKLALGAFSLVTTYRGCPEFTHLATTDEATYFVYRNTEDRPTLRILSDSFHLQLSELLGKVSNDDHKMNTLSLATIAASSEVSNGRPHISRRF